MSLLEEKEKCRPASLHMRTANILIIPMELSLFNSLQNGLWLNVCLFFTVFLTHLSLTPILYKIIQESFNKKFRAYSKRMPKTNPSLVSLTNDLFKCPIYLLPLS